MDMYIYMFMDWYILETYSKVFIIELIETDAGVAGITFGDCFI